MAKNVTGRKVMQFRSMIDPMIGPIPRNAFSMKEHGMEAEMTPAGIYVKVLKTGFEHILPFANCQSIRLAPEGGGEQEEKK